MSSSNSKIYAKKRSPGRILVSILKPRETTTVKSECLSNSSSPSNTPEPKDLSTLRQETEKNINLKSNSSPCDRTKKFNNSIGIPLNNVIPNNGNTISGNTLPLLKTENTSPILTEISSDYTINNNVATFSEIALTSHSSVGNYLNGVSQRSNYSPESNLPLLILTNASQNSIKNLSNNIIYTSDSSKNISSPGIFKTTLLNPYEASPNSEIFRNNSYNNSEDNLTSAFQTATGNSANNDVCNKVVNSSIKDSPLLILKTSSETPTADFSKSVVVNYANVSENNVPFVIFPNSSRNLIGDQGKNTIYNTHVETKSESSQLSSTNSSQNAKQIFANNVILQNNVLNHSEIYPDLLTLTGNSHLVENSSKNIIITDSTINSKSNLPLLILTNTNPISVANCSNRANFNNVYQTEDSSCHLSSASISASSTTTPSNCAFTNTNVSDIQNSISSSFISSLQTSVANSSSAICNSGFNSEMNSSQLLFTPQTSCEYSSSNVTYKNNDTCSLKNNPDLHSSESTSRCSIGTSSDNGDFKNIFTVSGNNSSPPPLISATTNSVYLSSNAISGGNNINNTIYNTKSNSHALSCSSDGISSNGVKYDNSIIPESQENTYVPKLMNTSEVLTGIFSNNIPNNASSQISIIKSPNGITRNVSNSVTSNVVNLPRSSTISTSQNSVKKNSDDVVLLIPMDLFAKIKSNKIINKSDNLPKIKTENISSSLTNTKKISDFGYKTKSNPKFFNIKTPHTPNNRPNSSTSNKITNVSEKMIETNKVSDPVRIETGNISNNFQTITDSVLTNIEEDAIAYSFHNTAENTTASFDVKMDNMPIPVIKLEDLSEVLDLAVDTGNIPTSVGASPLSPISLNNFDYKVKKTNDLTCDVGLKQNQQSFIIQQDPSMSDILSPLYKYLKGNKCLICGFISKSKEPWRIRKHLASHLKIKCFKCDKCDKRFATPGNLSIHKTVHSDGCTLPCNKCGLKFKSKSKLSIHKRKHSTPKSYTCTFCNSQYNCSNSLKEHLRVHTGEKPYACSTCYKTFRTRGMYKSHVLTHNEDKLYTCEICNKGYNNRSLLADHMNCHKRTPQYKCDICEKVFNFKSNLAQHMLVHNNKRRHVCDICGMKFKFPHHLRKHALTHESS